MENHNPRVRESDAVRQGSVVFDPPWKRKVFIAVIAATALIGAIALIIFI